MYRKTLNSSAAVSLLYCMEPLQKINFKYKKQQFAIVDEYSNKESHVLWQSPCAMAVRKRPPDETALCFNSQHSNNYLLDE